MNSIVNRIANVEQTLNITSPTKFSGISIKSSLTSKEQKMQDDLQKIEDCYCTVFMLLKKSALRRLWSDVISCKPQTAN